MVGVGPIGAGVFAEDHRTQLREWFARKAFYGASAAPLAVRHPGKTAPLVISGWTLLAWVLMAMGSYFAIRWNERRRASVL